MRDGRPDGGHTLESLVAQTKSDWVKGYKPLVETLGDSSQTHINCAPSIDNVNTEFWVHNAHRHRGRTASVPAAPAQILARGRRSRTGRFRDARFRKKA